MGEDGVAFAFRQPEEKLKRSHLSKSDQFGIGALEQAFLFLGYKQCADSMLEDGFEKVALYGSLSLYTHAARQLPNGRWTSKLGNGEDIEHEIPDNVGGGLYGEVVQFMKRPLTLPMQS